MPVPESKGPVVLEVLGSGTLVPDGRRSSAAHHVRAGAASVLLDCGSGALHGLARHGVDWERLTHVAITHFHYDHFGDLPALLLAFKYGTDTVREAPLTLVGPAGFRDHLHGVADALGLRFLDQSFPLDFVELGPDDRLEAGSGAVSIRCFPTPHTDESVAYALDTARGTVGYTGDTGPSPEVARFLSGCAVLVAECSHPDPPEVDIHLTPRGLAELARVARPNLLVVTHVYPSLSPRQAVARVSDLYEGRAVAAQDGLVVTLGDAGIAVDLPAGR